MPNDRTRPLRLLEAAALLGVQPNTLRRWSDAGRVPTLRLPTGARRYERAAIEQLRREMGFAEAERDAPAADERADIV